MAAERIVRRITTIEPIVITSDTEEEEMDTRELHHDEQVNINKLEKK